MRKDQVWKIIQNWHRAHRKEFASLPWRKTRDPYAVLVSEIMLQQTQISRVIPKFEAWMREFPTISALANSRFSKVLSLWHGLGYNRRARYLFETAKIIDGQWGGVVSKDPRVLETLPGIGHYTSRAVACFAYGRCEPFLDTNIRRTAIHFLHPKGKVGDDKILDWLKRHEPSRNRREWYLALMDYGREVLGKIKDNLNRKSKTYTKQSTFLGSRRYVRAKIISLLLGKKRGVNFGYIQAHLAGDKACKLFVEKIILASILQKLAEDGMIIEIKKQWRIAG